MNETPKIEWHYAPLTGGLARRVNDKWVVPKDWSENRDIWHEFFRLRENGTIALKETITYGHDHFNGHSGRVDIYV